MVYVSDVRGDICGYAIDIKHDKSDEHKVTLVFQKRKNAELVKRIIEIDNEDAGEANIEEIK